jgi:hypothetical protein
MNSNTMKDSLSFKLLAAIILAGLLLAVVNPGNSAVSQDARAIAATQR